jgi:tetratricopeptide (TPR) repeat protein
MQLKRIRIALSFVVFFGACAPVAPTPVPETAPIGEMAEHETQPRRAASLRVVEQARGELSKSMYERAAQKLARAIEIDPSNPYAYFYLGVVRLRVNRFEEAGELFLRSSNLFVNLEPWRAEALAYRGECFERLTRPEEARRAFEAALAVDSSNPRAHDGLSRLSEKVW